jgi:ABC-2 type transport system ATP-binding protein
MSITASNITKYYNTQKALDNVSFTVGKGEVVGFLGPNGAGKSTMMKILTCFIPQTEGKAEVCGYDVNEEHLEVRKKIGYLPENNPLYPEMYVKEYLEFTAGLYNMKGIQKRISEIIGITGLTPEYRKKIGALSKGYRQRVGLAQALLHDPEVLILDEPTSGLDPNQLAEVRSLIKSIGNEKTVMLSTHIMQEVEAVCSRAIIINKGKIVADESTVSLREKPKDSNSIIIEFNRQISLKQLMNIPGISSVKELGKNTWKISGMDKEDIRTTLFKWSVENDYTILSLQKEEFSLEDVFQKLTGE